MQDFSFQNIEALNKSQRFLYGHDDLFINLTSLFEKKKLTNKIIFNGIKQLEENIKTEIAKLNNIRTNAEYKSETNHPPNKINIIKCLLDYVNIEKDQLLKIVEKAYKKRNPLINS